MADRTVTNAPDFRLTSSVVAKYSVPSCGCVGVDLGLREILNRESVTQVRQELPHYVACSAGATRCEELQAMLLVEPPELAERDGSGVASEAELSQAPRELTRLLLGEGAVPVT